jgi:hypothetical protein
MKAIIDSKTYNTDTAEEIVTGSNIISNTYYNSTLYRTKKGAYFIVDFSDYCSAENGIELLGDPMAWIDKWNIKELPERELKAWDITEG